MKTSLKLILDATDCAGDRVVEICDDALEISKKLDICVEFEANNIIYSAFSWSTTEGIINAGFRRKGV